MESSNRMIPTKEEVIESLKPASNQKYIHERGSAYRVAAYFWKSKSKNRRVTWVFNSREKAIRWRRNKYYRYAENLSIETYLADIKENRHEVETRRWVEDKEGFLDLELHRSYVIFPRNGIRSAVLDEE